VGGVHAGKDGAVWKDPQLELEILTIYLAGVIPAKA
jgi:hypothetical protein